MNPKKSLYVVDNETGHTLVLIDSEEEGQALGILDPDDPANVIFDDHLGPDGVLGDHFDLDDLENLKEKLFQFQKHLSLAIGEG